MLEVPEIETPRLILRGLRVDDVDAYCEMMADDEVARFITPQRQGLSRMEAWRSMAMLVGHWGLRGYGLFAVEEHSTGRFVGRVGPWYPEGWPGLECGWTIARPWWGRGYASEAALAAMGWTFERFPDLDRIISLIEPANVASQRVAQKIGERNTREPFRCLGHEVEVWAAERADWLRRFAG